MHRLIALLALCTTVAYAAAPKKKSPPAATVTQGSGSPAVSGSGNIINLPFVYGSDSDTLVITDGWRGCQPPVVVQACDCREEFIAHAVMDWGVVSIVGSGGSPRVLVYDAPPIKDADGGVRFNFDLVSAKLGQAAFLLQSNQRQMLDAEERTRPKAKPGAPVPADGGAADSGRAHR